MSETYKLKMLVKAMWLASLLFLLVGCAGAPLSVQKQQTQIAGKDRTFAAVRSGTSIFGSTLAIYLFDDQANLLSHDVTSNAGIIESLGGAALNSLVPAHSAYEVLK
jgi:hypothetical protein